LTKLVFPKHWFSWHFFARLNSDFGTLGGFPGQGFWNTFESWSESKIHEHTMRNS